MGFYQDHILPHLVDLAMRNRELAPFRQRAISGAHGRVLEIGVGSGLNLPFYTPQAREIIALEPAPRLVSMARRKVAGAPAPVMLVEGSAEAIPLDDASIDTVVTTWTMCSIPDVICALGEMRRVLKPGGELRFVEHGRAPESNVRKWQDRLTPIWQRISGGCHLNRPIKELIETNGFAVARVDTGYLPGPRVMTFMYEGSARPR
jgi:ubiquinone/menaquinone biosynthesis C-methylase UbiE